MICDNCRSGGFPKFGGTLLGSFVEEDPTVWGAYKFEVPLSSYFPQVTGQQSGSSGGIAPETGCRKSWRGARPVALALGRP